MNRPAHLFRTLAHAFNRDAADPAVDALAAELAAELAADPAPRLLGVLRREAIPRYYNLVFVLDGYGLILRQRYRDDGRSAWLWLEPRGEAASEFEGATVRVRRAPRPDAVALGVPELPALAAALAAPRRTVPALPEAA